VQINTINKDEIDIKSSVIGLMPNFIHSLDASHIHEITFFILKLRIEEIKKELTNVHNRYENLDIDDKLKVVEKYLIKNYDLSKVDERKITEIILSDFDLIKYSDGNITKTVAFLINLPFYSIHDCIATTANNMALIKNNVTLIFSDMYFSIPFLQTLHINLLKQILLINDDIFGYPSELIKTENSSKDKNEK
jgi:DNA-dependent RNA polymerase